MAVVLVRNACKNYGSTPIVENLNMTVKPGSIYGLLGESGCGKTTLLSCLVGLKQLDHGIMKIFGNRPGQENSRLVGYMPQETALYPMFTIPEILAYYGTIYGMTSKEIATRIEFLTKILDLPTKLIHLDSLSGGEERRVSLAVSMIHSPPLLVLDEATAGLDPLLRERIWQYMSELVQTKEISAPAIIISTHYIEEAKFCDVVGIMRRGRLIAEQNPTLLMAFHDSIYLETAVLQLCQDDEIKHGPTKRTSPVFNKGRNFIPIPDDDEDDYEEYFDSEFSGVKLTKIRKVVYDDPYDSNPTPNNIKWSRISDEGSRLTKNFNIVTALAKKNYLIKLRHPLLIISLLILPVFQMVLNNTVMGAEPLGQPMAYVSSDWNIYSSTHTLGDHTLFDYCANTYVKYSSVNKGSQACFKDEMSTICTFLNQFDAKDITWIPTSSVQESLNLVHNGDAIGYLEFPANFTHHFRNRGMYRNFADNETIDGASLKIRMDLSNSISSAWLANKLLNRYHTFAKETIQSCGEDPSLIEMPLKYNAIFGELEGQSWIMYFQPGIITTFLFILTTVNGVVWVTEKRLKISDRGTVAGIKFGHIIAASIISDTVIIIVQIGIVMFMMLNLYDLEIKGSWELAVLLMFLLSLSGQSVGYTFATLTNNEIDIILILLFINGALLVGSGVVWPLETVMMGWRVFCLILPVSIPTASLRSIIFRGWGLDHPEVLQGFVVTIGWIVVTLGLNFWLNRRKK